ncbi:hypothetical protein G6F56_005541 [Rhizopus delemar]|nr:hypothetical protein G6F56_005541 [Rhizopus delemar]
MRFSLLLISTLATLTYFASAIPVNAQDVAQPQSFDSPALMKRYEDEHEWKNEWEHEWEHDGDDEDCDEEEEEKKDVSKEKKVAPKEKTIYFFHTVTATTTITKGHDHDEKHDRDHGDGGRDWNNGDRREWDHGFDLSHLFDHHRELNVPTGASAVVAAAPTAAPVSV